MSEQVKKMDLFHKNKTNPEMILFLSEAHFMTRSSQINSSLISTFNVTLIQRWTVCDVSFFRNDHNRLGA